MAELILHSSGSTLFLPDGYCFISIVFAQTQFPITISHVLLAQMKDAQSVFHSVGFNLKLT